MAEQAQHIPSLHPPPAPAQVGEQALQQQEHYAPPAQ